MVCASDLPSRISADTDNRMRNAECGITASSRFTRKIRIAVKFRIPHSELRWSHGRIDLADPRPGELLIGRRLWAVAIGWLTAIAAGPCRQAFARPLFPALG